MRKLLISLGLLSIVFSACAMSPKEKVDGLGNILPIEEHVVESEVVGLDIIESSELIEQVKIEPIVWSELVESYNLVGFSDNLLGISLDSKVKETKTYKFLSGILNDNQVQVIVKPQVEPEDGNPSNQNGVIVKNEGKGFIYLVSGKSDVESFEVLIQYIDGESFLFLEVDLGEGLRVYKVPQKIESLETEVEELRSIILETFFWEQGKESPMNLINCGTGVFIQEIEEIDVYIESFVIGDTGKEIQYIYLGEDLIAIREVTGGLSEPIVVTYTVIITTEIDTDLIEGKYTLFHEVPKELKEWVGDMVYVNTGGRFGKPTDLEKWSPSNGEDSVELEIKNN